MENITRLRVLLVNALAGRLHGEQELFHELGLQAETLSKLLDVGPRNNQELREIESGKTTVHGKPLAINSDFARQTVFVSQQLDCSERYVAGLLRSIMMQNPNLGDVACVERTIVEHHKRRRDLVDCLRYLLEAAEAAEATEAPVICTQLAAFVHQQLLPPGDSRLASGILKAIENLDVVLTRAQNARQNAGTNTMVTPQGTPVLGRDVLDDRCRSLQYEQRYLAHVLSIISSLGCLSSTDIQRIIDWLSANPHHPVTFYLLTATLAAFDPVNPDSASCQNRAKVASDKGFMAFMKKKLDPSFEWKEPGLKGTLLLKWTLFLTEARHRDASLEHREGFRTEELETQIWNAAQGDAFTYLLGTVMQIQTRRVDYHSPLSSVVSSEQERREAPAEDFKPIILRAFEVLVRSLITHASSELRKIKQRQEDLVVSNVRTDRHRMFRPSSSASHPPSTSDPEKPTPPARNDIAVLYQFIGALYSALPAESALQFWGSGPPAEKASYLEYVEATAGKLPAFLQWVVWSTQSRDLDMSIALYDMLSGLAKGQHCSELAYNFLARGANEVVPGSTLPSSQFSSGPGVSWSIIFGLLELWASPSSTSHAGSSQQRVGSSQPPQTQSQPAIGQKDVILAQSFLKLLSTVATYSVAVRIAICGHAQFRAIPTLVSLIPLAIPLELKGAIFYTLSAFCEPGAGTPGVEICRAVWVLMERLEVINVRGGGGIAAKGVELELEEVETVYKMYPSTIPFLKLLGTLIHTPKLIPSSARFADFEPISTIPDSLGHPYRLPGIRPFVSFAIDTVFGKIASRDYLRPSDRWQLNDLCLRFMERCLASYDLESLVTVAEDIQARGPVILSLSIHPGYEVLIRLLTNSPLQASILSYIVDGVEGFDKEFPNEEPYFHTTIVRVLRIVHRVLEVQDIFIDIFLPLLVEVDSTPMIGQVPARSYFTRFDQAMSFGPEYVPAVAAYVAFPAYPELVLLAVKILTSLCSSTAFTNLASLIERSTDSDRILYGFQRLLVTESTEDATVAEAAADRLTGAGAPNPNVSESLLPVIRLAVLELLLQHTKPGSAYPNLSHFLLFGTSTTSLHIQDPHAQGAQSACIHVILDLLNTGVPRLKGKGKEREQHSASQSLPLFATHPSVAERCYRVLSNLCTHPRTSDFTMRYLRTHEDFFARHLSAVPFNIPVASREPHIEVVYADGSRVVTTVDTTSSFLRLRSWVLQLVAVELHILTRKGHQKSVTELLELLFSNSYGYGDDDDSTDMNAGGFQEFHEIGQSHMRIIEFLQSLEFDWSDSISVKPVELQLFAQLDLQSCIRVADSGCEIVDKIALLSLLSGARAQLHTQGHIATSSLVEQLDAETTYIITSCAVENNRRQVRFAVETSHQAWKRLLDVTLTNCFVRLPHDRRENMLFDLLHVLPAIIRSPTVQEPTAVLLSEAILSCITKLREDRRHQAVIQSAGVDVEAGSLPAERLYALLRSILECILDNNRLELVRGNLYAAVINYLHLIASTRSDQRPTGFSMSLSASTSVDDVMSVASQSTFGSTYNGSGARHSPSSLEAGSLSVLKGAMERLIDYASRDAVDGTEVWKTVSFTLLDALVQLSHIDKSHVALNSLVRRGFLSSFVRGLKESDLQLQSVLKPDPDDLNPLYVYEAKFSFLIRVAETRQGAERLLEARLLPTLAQCDYLDARPDADQSFMDQDSFLPSAIQRYHQLLVPALQLVLSMLATLGPKHATAANQALDFLSGHRDTLIILLKNDSPQISISMAEEFHLVVSLCACVLPFVSKAELLSGNSGFGGIHVAVLSLSAKCLGSGRWTQTIRPVSDTDALDASLRASTYTTETKFDLKIRRLEQSLRKATLVYLGNASDFTEPELAVVLSPIVVSPREEERSSHFIATVPTIGDTIEALHDICADLSSTLKQIVDLSAEISSRDHIRVDDMEQIAGPFTADDLRDLDLGQRRSLLCQEYERARKDERNKALSLLNTVEMLLLLIWRHLVHYSGAGRLSTRYSKAILSQSMRFVTPPDAETFQSEAAKRIVPVLKDLESLDLDGEVADWRSSEAYIEIMCRRLRDTVGLREAADLADNAQF